MNEKKHSLIQPDYAVPPGITLLEIIESIGMSQVELAHRTGRPLTKINEIIKGKNAITPNTAIQLEHVLGVPASFWNNLERNYQDAVARQEEKRHLEQSVEWVKQFPTGAMIKNGWIKRCKNKVEQLQEILRFFAVASPEAWESTWKNPRVVFRSYKSFNANPGAIAAWLRQGEIQAQKVNCGPYDRARFQAEIEKIRPITRESIDVFAAKTIEFFAETGVAVTFIKELPSCPVSGAARWLTPEKALIQMNIRYKRDDHLFFNLFHEVGHILRHGKKKFFIDTRYGDDDTIDELEEEANRFARDFLIPLTAYKKFCNNQVFTHSSVKHFAEDHDIAPGIVVGRLQRDKIIPYNSYLNNLCRSIEWATIAERSLHPETASLSPTNCCL